MELGAPTPVVLSAERQPGGTPPMPWFRGTLGRGASGQQRMGFSRVPVHAKGNLNSEFNYDLNCVPQTPNSYADVLISECGLIWRQGRCKYGSLR